MKKLVFKYPLTFTKNKFQRQLHTYIHTLSIISKHLIGVGDIHFGHQMDWEMSRIGMHDIADQLIPNM